MGLISFVSNLKETKERHPLKALQTHYFKANFQKTKDVLKTYANEQGWTLKSENNTYGELFFRGKKHHMIATLIQTSPAETAVDLKVQTYYIMGFNRPKKRIIETFAAMQKALTLKGTGLKA